MSSNKNLVEFPNAEAKLQKPIEKSAFERRKAADDAKRKRAEEENAEALQDFLKSFAPDDDDDDSRKSRQAPTKFGTSTGPLDRERPPFVGQGPYGGGTGKRHFGVPSGTPLKSGPGSLGPAPSSFSKKRTYDGFQSGHQRGPDEVRGRLGFEGRESGPLSLSKAFDNGSDEEEKPAFADRAEEKATSKPTLRLINLPPNTSPLAIKALIPSTLTVENVKIAPPSGPSGAERKSITAIVTLATETSAKDIESTVNTLQNKYLGYGYFLSLHRHLSSAAIASGLPTVHSSTTVTQPFGAKRVEQTQRSYGPSSTYNHGVPPPESYNTPAGISNGMGPRFYVPVNPPRDINMLRMIHMVVESVLKHGPEFEALLMSRPDVQREEQWAWIWDARSEGGIWYRWRLWEVASGSERSRVSGERVRLFEGKDYPYWKAPSHPLPYEFITYVDELVSDSEYNSEDEDAFEDNGKGINNEEDTFLNPRDKAKLAYLLGRLPTTLAKLRKGDISRVTAFAITHASRGADEVVDMVLRNIESPFAFTSANAERRQQKQCKDSRGDNSREASPAGTNKQEADAPEKSTAAHLIGLYVASDIIFCSGQGGIRHSWRFRQIFESALKKRKTFEMLGMLSEKLNLGRLRADKWKRSVRLVLDLWESWAAFPGETQVYFVDSFENPPMSKKDTAENEQEKKTGRWKSIEAQANTPLPVSEQPLSQAEPPADAEYDEAAMDSNHSDGDSAYPKIQYHTNAEAFFSDDDLDGEPDEDFGVLLSFGQQDMIMKDIDNISKTPSSETKPAIKLVGGFRISASSNAGPPRKRMQAMDMFADVDSDGDN